jgi:hypothetical protein
MTIAYWNPGYMYLSPKEDEDTALIKAISIINENAGSLSLIVITNCIFPYFLPRYSTPCNTNL